MNVPRQSWPHSQQSSLHSDWLRPPPTRTERHSCQLSRNHNMGNPAFCLLHSAFLRELPALFLFQEQIICWKERYFTLSRRDSMCRNYANTHMARCKNGINTYRSNSIAKSTIWNKNTFILALHMWNAVPPSQLPGINSCTRVPFHCHGRGNVSAFEFPIKFTRRVAQLLAGSPFWCLRTNLLCSITPWWYK